MKRVRSVFSANLTALSHRTVNAARFCNKAAKAHESIQEVEDGYDSDARRAMLFVGQRRRVALARALCARSHPRPGDGLRYCSS